MAASPKPRIRPGTRSEIGWVNFTIARALGAAAGTGPPSIFTTLARHRRLFRPWLRFAGRLMPGGTLPRDEAELLILRTAHNCGCAYEWSHHERLGRRAGLSAEEIARVREGPRAEGWSERRRAMLTAADELHETRTISDAVWEELANHLSERKLIELCMLVGHYEMLAMTLNAIGVEPDPPAGEPSRVARLVQGIAERGSGSR